MLKPLQNFSLRHLVMAVVATFFLSHPCQAEGLRVLFLGDNGHHQPRVRYDELEPVMQARGIEFTYTDDLSDINLKKLKQFDALVLYANIDAIEPNRAEAILTYVAEGGGFVPLHCASFCFRNVPELVALMGAQFQRHGTGVFRADDAQSGHEIMSGYGGFKSWDETYVHHLHNEKNRTVLEYRVDAEGREPWTWVRTHGDGRVFYTAWGHDGRTWLNPGFQNLVERGIRWVTGDDPQKAGAYVADMPFPTQKIKQPLTDAGSFEYIDVGRQIPDYRPSGRSGASSRPLGQMQKPVSPEKSMKHIAVPEGFHVELFASEVNFAGKPICMTWDERGRLWIAETVDYPNELQPEDTARDRIRICEDTDEDGEADKFTIFAERLSIPTSIAFSNGGVLVQNGTETILLKDTDGDDIADERKVLITNWQLGDTHGGVSNFQYGLDNWIWAMQGYNNSRPIALGKEQQAFRMGFFRMRPDGSEVEFIRSTNNNTWGLGISEEGLILGSTANGNPSVFMPIANRYYERVRGWAPSLTLGSIADTFKFNPITGNVRQVDFHGGYTAAAGHALYTAREYPKEFWNRVAFVCEPTGHLVGSFVLNRTGSDFTSTSPFNLFASNDEWTAPIMAEVGPDGHVWVLDWYNYIVQHNPTPEGFRTGKGAAYETELRDKKHGRIYRIVADNSTRKPTPNLANASADELVEALSHPTMLVRKHAQRLLVESGNTKIAGKLIQLIQSPSVDEIGLNVGAIHALWTLHGLNLLDGKNQAANAAVFAALEHPSAGVRRNALQVLPPLEESVVAMQKANIHRDRDAQVQLAAILALSDLPTSEVSAQLVLAVLGDESVLADRWIPDAVTSAAAQNSSRLLGALAVLKSPSDKAIEIIGLAANHFARSDNTENAPDLLAALADADPRLVEAVIQGFNAGLSGNQKVKMSAATEASLEKLLDIVSPGTKGSLVKLATAWGSERFAKYGKEIADGLLVQIRDEEAEDNSRVQAAKRLVEFLANDDEVVASLLDEVSPRTAPAVAGGLVEALGGSRSDVVGEEVVERFATFTPSLKSIAVVQLLKRPTWTRSLLKGIEQGKANLTDLALDQKQALASHADRDVRNFAKRLMEQGGALPNADRQKVLDEFAFVSKKQGDAAAGKLAFTTHCSKCHVHSGEGVNVGPDLTGMAVHPKEELLTHILDPSRSVEGNFRAYSVLTLDGVVINGMLASESKTAIELFDAEGKKKSILREDIDQFTMSTKSIMPEGFEKSMKATELIDLLEFLTKRGKFVPIDLGKVANISSDRSLFSDPNNSVERLVFDDWQPKTFAGVPFQIADPRDGTVANTIVLYSPNGEISRKLPRKVSVPFNGPIRTLHLLSGVGGWAFPFGEKGAVALTVRLQYADGTAEDHDLLNGEHFADFIRRVDVPQSQFAFDLAGRQIRYLSITPKRNAVVSKIDLVKGRDVSAPVVMAITAETADTGH